MIVIFKSELSVSPVGSDRWRVNAPFVVEIDGQETIVPVGFETDLASIPKVLTIARSFLQGKARRAAVLHDYLYATRAGKAHADDVFMAAMKAEGVSGFVRGLFFAAVHHFGGLAYDSKEPYEPPPAFDSASRGD